MAYFMTAQDTIGAAELSTLVTWPAAHRRCTTASRGGGYSRTAHCNCSPTMRGSGTAREHRSRGDSQLWRGTGSLTGGRGRCRLAADCRRYPDPDDHNHLATVVFHRAESDR